MRARFASSEPSAQETTRSCSFRLRFASYLIPEYVSVNDLAMVVVGFHSLLLHIVKLLYKKHQSDCALSKSVRASFIIDHDECKNRQAIIVATTKSGHGVSVHATIIAAATTAALPIASLRENNQTARMLESPLR